LKYIYIGGNTRLIKEHRPKEKSHVLLQY